MKRRGGSASATARSLRYTNLVQLRRRYWVDATGTVRLRARPRPQPSPGEELPLFQMIREREYQREPYLLFETLRAVAEEQVNFRGGEVLKRDGQPLAQLMPQGLCLDEAIDRAMSRTDDPGSASG